MRKPTPTFAAVASAAVLLALLIYTDFTEPLSKTTREIVIGLVVAGCAGAGAARAVTSRRRKRRQRGTDATSPHSQ